MKNVPFLLETLAEEIDKQRQGKKLTRQALADFSELQYSYIRGLLKAERNPSIEALYGLCSALGIEVWEFLRIVEEKRRAKKINRGLIERKKN